MERKRKYHRFTRRFEVKFSSGGTSFTGISSNLSENDIFIRTQKGFAPGTALDLELILPDGKISSLKGIVKRTVKTSISALKNGMGIEIIEKDKAYIDFINSLNSKTETPSEDEAISEFQIISCPSCGTKNKVLSSKIYLSPRCGRCKASLFV
jgi:hypothetical protein